MQNQGIHTNTNEQQKIDIQKYDKKDNAGIANLFLGLYNTKEYLHQENLVGISEIIENLCKGFDTHYELVTYDIKVNNIGNKYIEIKNHHDRVICVIGTDVNIKTPGAVMILFDQSNITLISDDYSWKGSIGEFLLYHELDDHNKIYVNETYKHTTKYKDIVDNILLGYNIANDSCIDKILYDKQGRFFQYLDYKDGEISVIMDENCEITYNNNLWTEVFLVGEETITHVYGYDKYVYSHQEFMSDYIDWVRGENELIYSTNDKKEYTNLFGELRYMDYETEKIDNVEEGLTLEDLDKEQRKVALQLQLGKNVFVSGRAGTGKSAIIKLLEDIFPESDIVKTASTGFAAMNIGGRTTPSTMRLKIFESDDLEIREKNEDNYLIAEADIIVIDEVLMYNIENMRQIDIALKAATGNNILFGGKQIICLGDIAQLEPFTGSNPIGSDFFKDFVTIDLQTIHRQESPVFQNILETYRQNVLDALSSAPATNNWLQHTSKNWQPGMIIADTKERADEINNLFISKLTTEHIDVTPQITGNYTKELPYEHVKYFVGMQVMCIRNGRYYNADYEDVSLVNGDIGIIEDISPNRIKVYFQNKRESIWIENVSDEEYTKDNITFAEALKREVQNYEDEYDDLNLYDDDYEYDDYDKIDEDSEYTKVYSSIEHDAEKEEAMRYEAEKKESIGNFTAAITEKLKALQNKEGNITIKKFAGSISYFPLIPSYAVSVRKAQGVTLEQGVLDISVLNTPYKRLQYVGISRFKSLEKIFVTDVIKYLNEQKDGLGIHNFEDISNLLQQDYAEATAMYIYSHFDHYTREDKHKIAKLLLDSNLLPVEYKEDLEIKMGVKESINNVA